VIHCDTELRFVNPDIGYGVFATRLIPKGTITWVRDCLDQAFTPEAVERLPEAYHDIVLKYSFIDAHSRFVLCWDHARYVNHSCDPTCLSAGYDFELAMRDIPAGAELTDDYGSLNLEYGFECRCGSPRCRHQIRPGDLLRFALEWDRLVAEPFSLIRSVPQPLWLFLEERDAVEDALAHRTPVASVTRNFVDVPALLRGHRLLASRTEP
jgi:uncharacterized protein